MKTKKNPQKTAKKNGVLFYMCEFCSKVSAKRSSVCKAIKSKDLYTCEYCGKTHGYEEGLCLPVLVEPKFTCSTCHTVSPYQARICSPKSI